MATTIRGIDVSEHQGNIDWEKVKASGVKFVVLRCGYGSDSVSQDDATFKRNADECTRLGIPFGVYLFSYANTIAKAKSEAEHTLRVIKEYKLDYPVFYDLEDKATTGSCSKTLIGDMAEIYCETIKAAGYHVGVYASASWFNSILTDPRFDNYDKWVAQYNYELEYTKPVTMWQYSSKGKVNGINGGVDMNYCYIDYPALINNISYETDTFKPVEIEKEDEPAELNVIEHIVKAGDTLTDIALKYDTTVTELVEMNKIQNANLIHIGDVIKIATMTDTFETPVKKSVDEIAKEVIAGKWETKQERRKLLTKAGYDADEVQERVNFILSGNSIDIIEKVAKDVIAGKYGNGSERRSKLIKAGYDPEEVQNKVNELL